MVTDSARGGRTMSWKPALTPEQAKAETFSADKSCYVQIGGYTVYIEVSEATDNAPLVNYWTADYPQDTVTNMVMEQADD